MDIEAWLDRFCVIEIQKLTGTDLTGNEDSVRGLYVAEYDADAMNGVGAVRLTAKLAEAKRYKDGNEAIRDYLRQSTVRPLREDGELNRPMTAYDVAIVDKLVGDLSNFAE